MKHVVFVVSDLSIGGAQWHLIRNVEGLIERGLRISIIATGSEADLASMLPKEVPVYFLGGKTSSPILWAKFFSTVRKLNADVVVGRSLYPNLLVGLARFSKNIRKAVVIENNHPGILLQNMSWLRSRAVRLLVSFLYRHVDVVGANSDEILEILRLWVGSRPRYVRIYNPVDLDNFHKLSMNSPTHSNQAPRELVLLAVGRMWNKQKGFDVLLRACARLMDYPQPWKLWMVGGGADLEMLKTLAGTLGLANHVVWFGMQANTFPYYRQADIVVLSSRHEGFPNVLLEAMALGKSIVATDCLSGPREITDNGKVGMLVPVDDDKAMAEALMILMDDPNRRKKLGRAGKEFIAKTYSHEKVMSQLLLAINI